LGASLLVSKVIFIYFYRAQQRVEIAHQGNLALQVVVEKRLRQACLRMEKHIAGENGIGYALGAGNRPDLLKNWMKNILLYGKL
jgi:hypothetical protein